MILLLKDSIISILSIIIVTYVISFSEKKSSFYQHNKAKHLEEYNKNLTILLKKRIGGMQYYRKQTTFLDSRRGHGIHYAKRINSKITRLNQLEPNNNIPLEPSLLKNYKIDKANNVILAILLPRHLWPYIQPIRTLFNNNIKIGPYIPLTSRFVKKEHIKDVAQTIREFIDGYDGMRTIHLTVLDSFSNTSKNRDEFVNTKTTIDLMVARDICYYPMNIKSYIINMIPDIKLYEKENNYDERMAMNLFTVPFFDTQFMQQLFEEIVYYHLAKPKMFYFNFNEIYILQRDTPQDLYEIAEVIPLSPGPFKFDFEKDIVENRTDEERVKVDNTPEFGPSNLGPNDIYGRTIVVPNLDNDFTDEKLLQLFEDKNFYPTKYEVLLQSNEKPSSVGVVEFFSLDEAYRCLRDWKHETYVVKHLINLSYPGPVGDSCSLKAVKKENTRITPKKVSYDPIKKKYLRKEIKVENDE